VADPVRATHVHGGNPVRVLERRGAWTTLQIIHADPRRAVHGSVYKARVSRADLAPIDRSSAPEHRAAAGLSAADVPANMARTVGQIAADLPGLVGADLGELEVRMVAAHPELLVAGLKGKAVESVPADPDKKESRSIVKTEYKRGLTVTRRKGGPRLMDCNDRVARRLRGAPLAQLYAEAALLLSGAESHGLFAVGDEEKALSQLKRRYGRLNPGQQSMNLRNVIRGLLPPGED
jgi:hypothetical protein